ncbi:MAG: histidine phosphatase family protein [Chloroflexi bacterium]|nr:histidine phosphatase family protein [Chloroflexota bacterium]
MKYLSIWRHAKAERPEQYQNDFDRPLADRGLRDAARMAALIAALEPGVDRILSSPAARTAQTVQKLLEALGGRLEPVWDATLYLAPATTLLSILKTLPEDVGHLVLVGHNPGLEELASGLCGTGPADSFVRMPTATLAHLTVDANRWHSLRWGGSQLKLLIPPKAFENKAE